MRNGDFSRLTDAQGRQIVIYDPLTTDVNGNRQPFPATSSPRAGSTPLAAPSPTRRPMPTEHPDYDDGSVNLPAQDIIKSKAHQNR